jgi:hypothetical protein
MTATKPLKTFYCLQVVDHTRKLYLFRVEDDSSHYGSRYHIQNLLDYSMSELMKVQGQVVKPRNQNHIAFHTRLIQRMRYVEQHTLYTIEAPTIEEARAITKAERILRGKQMQALGYTHFKAPLVPPQTTAVVPASPFAVPAPAPASNPHQQTIIQLQKMLAVYESEVKRHGGLAANLQKAIDAMQAEISRLTPQQ